MQIEISPDELTRRFKISNELAVKVAASDLAIPERVKLTLGSVIPLIALMLATASAIAWPASAGVLEVVIWVVGVLGFSMAGVCGLAIAGLILTDNDPNAYLKFAHRRGWTTPVARASAIAAIVVAALNGYTAATVFYALSWVTIIAATAAVRYVAISQLGAWFDKENES